MSAGRSWVPVFFASAACSWVPHWSCHYYRLETASSFAVGSWQFTKIDSLVALLIYSLLIIANLWATTAAPVRVPVAGLSGILHLGFAGLHFYRVALPFRFEVLGYSWSLTASLREAIILSLFGLLSIGVAAKLGRERAFAPSGGIRERAACAKDGA